MNSNGEGAKFYAAVGSETAPAYTFSSEPVTGILLDEPGVNSEFAIVKRGTKRFRVSDTQTEVIGPFVHAGPTASDAFSAGDGSVTAPSFTFTSQPTTGAYLENPGTTSSEYAISKSGTKRLRISDTLTEVVGPFIHSGPSSSDVFLAGIGSAAAPAFSFQSQNNTGFYLQGPGPGTVRFSVGGTESGYFGITGTPFTYHGPYSGDYITAQNDDAKLYPIGGYRFSADSVGTGLHMDPTGNMLLDNLRSDVAGSKITLPGDGKSGEVLCNKMIFNNKTDVNGAEIQAGYCTTLRPVDVTGAPAFRFGATGYGIGMTDSSSVSMIAGSAPMISCTTGQATVYGNLIVNGTITKTENLLCLRMSAQQSVASGVITYVMWDTVDTTLGGAVNWPAFYFTAPSNTIIIPVDGTYLLTGSIIWDSYVGTRDTWVEINAGGTPGLGRRFSEQYTNSFSSTNIQMIGKFLTNTTIKISVYQAAGVAVHINGGTNAISQLQIKKIGQY